MLESIYLKNYILIPEAEISFRDGLNIVTGESGAGKSILVGALAQLAGARSSTDSVRQGARKAIIEGRFNLNGRVDLSALFNQLDLDYNRGELIIRKEITSGGSSRIFVNDTPVTLNVLNKISRRLLDLHGQHEHQNLLHPENHLSYLDLFADNATLKDRFARLLERYQALRKKHQTLLSEKETARQTEELYRFQQNELERHQLDEADLEELRDELRRLSNFEKIHQAAQTVLAILTENEPSLSSLLSEVEEQLRFLGSLDAEFAPYREALEQSRAMIDETGQFTERYLNTQEFDPQRAEYVRQRLSDLEFLLKKYRCTDMPALIAYRDSLTEKLETIAHVDHFIEEVEKELQETVAGLQTLGEKIHDSRRAAARVLREAMTIQLREMAMQNGTFFCDLTPQPAPNSPFTLNGMSVEIFENGFDTARFMFNANPGEAPRPLHKIASGGELSRIMLAIKNVLAERDRIPLMVFDEIDSGISGKTAQMVGGKIDKLARHHQVICVTHLPQIAAFADHHIRVSKNGNADTTTVALTSLNTSERIEEIAALLGGEEIDAQSRANAKALLERSGKIT